MVRLSTQALTQLAQYRAVRVQPGEIYWLPKELAKYRGSTKPERPWLVVALDGGRAHLVPGTSGRACSPRFVVAPKETDLPKRTEFDFSVSVPVNLLDLSNDGRPAGSLDPARWPEVVTVVDRSRQVVLKRLVVR